MRNIRCSALAACLGMVLCGCSHLPDNKDVLYQTSTIGALLEGVYDGHMTCKELRDHGDFGIGTFHALDGEMVVLEGEVYRVGADGKAHSVDDMQRTPFAIATFFDADETLHLAERFDYKALEQRLDALLPTENILYAIKVEGDFYFVKTRSVPRQSKPYPRLIEVVEKQPTFELHDVHGTIVGFRLPRYMEGINVPGYHLHFLTEDRDAGGHVLDFSTRRVRIEVDYMRAFHMTLPAQGDFYKAEMAHEKQGEVEKIEK